MTDAECISLQMFDLCVLVPHIFLAEDAHRSDGSGDDSKPDLVEDCSQGGTY